jgi:mRNA interferase RelE/StbE
MYSVELSREAARFFERCDTAVCKNLTRCFAALEADPRAGNNVKPLKGPFTGAYRYRVGDLRVVYKVDDRAVTVYVIAIAKRSDVYE